MSDFTNYNNANSHENQILDLKPNKTKHTKGGLFIISIVFLVLGFLISCLNAFINFKQKSRIDAQYAAGYAGGIIIFSLLIIVVFFLLSTRVFKKKVVLLIFSIIFFLGSSVSTVATINTALKEFKKDEAGIEKFISIYDNIVAGQDVSNENFDKSTYGNMAPILCLMQDYGGKFYNLSTNMSNDIHSLELENLLAPDTLKSTGKINKSKKNLETYMKLLDKYEADNNDLIKNFDNEASTLKLPNSYKSAFLNGFRKSQIEVHDIVNDFFKVEKDSCSKYNDLLNFMLSIQGTYTVQGNQILFKTNYTLNKYNEYINDIQQLSQKKADIQNSIKENQKLKRDKLINQINLNNK